jgi:spermidine synthase
MAKGFESEKLTLHFGDGFEFLKNHQQEFDVIITDSSDHKGVLLFKLCNLFNYLILNKKKIIIGPAGSLWNSHYYELMKEALKPNGIVCNQGGKKLILFFF